MRYVSPLRLFQVAFAIFVINAAAAGTAPQLLISPVKGTPFREPATGLVYVRDRWQNTATGTFVTPDRMGFRDSSNAYEFVGGDPVNRSDATGMYQADFHYAMTAFLGRASCLDPAVADRIAEYAEAPDQDVTRNPLINGGLGWAGLKQQQAILREWHFPKPDLNTGAVTPGSWDARQKVEAGLITGDIQAFGEGLHPFEDSWSHRGVPSIKGFAGHPDERGGRFSTATDIPWRYPVEALEAAHETFKYMQRFADRHPQYARLGACRSWQAISSEVLEYISLRERPEKMQWLLTHGIVMPRKYWDDVDMGPDEKKVYDRLRQIERQSGPRY